MDLVLDKRKSSRRHKSPLPKRFEKLCGMIERQRRLDVRFRKDLDELVETFEGRSIEIDRVVFEDRHNERAAVFSDAFFEDIRF